MSEEVRNALRPSLDSAIAEFVDASIAITKASTSADVSALQNDLSNMASRITKIEEDVAALAAVSGREQIAFDDDKYALTKAKLVRLMVDMGYMK